MAYTRLVLFCLLLVTALPPPLPAQPDVNNETYFLLTNRESVVVLNLQGEVLHTLSHTDSVQVDFDPTTAKVIWPGGNQRTINSAFIKGTHRTILQLLSGSRPVGVAVDHLEQLVFYSDANKRRIGVMDTEGGSHRVVRDQGLTKPSALAVDVIHEFLYYTEDTTSGDIGRMAYNGSSHQVLHNSLSFPLGLALDVRGGRLYWSTWADGRLESSALDGTDRTLVLQDQIHQFGLAFFDGVLYFTFGGVSSIFSVNVNGTNRQELTVQVKEPTTYYDIAVYSQSRAITSEEKLAALGLTVSTTPAPSSESSPTATVAGRSGATTTAGVAMTTTKEGTSGSSVSVSATPTPPSESSPTSTVARASGATTTAGVSVTTTKEGTSGSSVSDAVVAVAAVGSVLALLVFAACLLLLRLRRKSPPATPEPEVDNFAYRRL